MEIVQCKLKDEAEALDELKEQCAALGTFLEVKGDEVIARPAR
jgi:hypothetical protein